MGRRQRLGIPPIHCSARAKHSGERCKNWARPGTLVCRYHGGESPQALARAQVRLTLGELAQADPRPMAEVLRDAVALADVAQRDVWSALRNGEVDASVADRLLEVARYSAALVQVAVNAGLPLHEDDTRVPVETFSDVAAAALADVADTLTGLVEVRSPDDVAYRERVSTWSRDALRARLRSEPLPPFPVRAAVAEPEIVYAGRDDRQPEADVVDVEFADDGDDDVVEEPDDLVALRAEVAQLRVAVGEV
jgi:hypothetical protein